ncbi:MAG: hypothetical protein EXS36_03165 [Pedosphaera sp.]|nr:hypothetical protein [Pedosphaera sp.]
MILPGSVCLRFFHFRLHSFPAIRRLPLVKLLAILATLSCSAVLATAAQWVTYDPKPGPGAGKHIVMLSGDEEYRSEEGLPQLGRILSQRHGFKCTVLFSQDPDGTINPNNQTNIPGMHLLATADLVILQFRFRELPDADMQHFVNYLNSGKPMMVLRTATHSFNYDRNKNSVFATYDWRFKGGVWNGGFGGRVVGETWTYHHGDHGKEATRGVIDGRNRSHPVLHSVTDVFGPTDVYGVNSDFPADATILLHGQVLKGMNPEDGPNLQKAAMPLVWMREYRGDTGNKSKVFCSTIGAATDLRSEDLRRLFVNACYNLSNLEVPKKADVDLIGTYEPSKFGFNTYRKGVKVSDHEMK